MPFRPTPVPTSGTYCTYVHTLLRGLVCTRENADIPSIEHLIAHICLDHAWLPVSWLEKHIHGGWMQTIDEDPPDS